MTTREWMDDAACLDWDPELFYPDPSESPHDALAICRDCPVRNACLEYALTEDIRWGVWGGFTEAQRERMRRWRCRRCGTAITSQRRYCEACKPLVRAANIARYKQSVRVR